MSRFPPSIPAAPWLLPRSHTDPSPRNPDVLARAAGFCRVAGVDEVGRGPWAGPVVAAAVILRRRRRLPTRIDDSKRLTAAQRLRAFRVILDHAEVGFGIASAEAVDQHAIVRASLSAMGKAVHDLPAAPDLVLVDGPMSPSVPTPCWPIIHGDRLSYAISCASIMAKVLRDRLMEFYHELYPHYAFHRHKGYGTSLHQRRLAQFGPSFLHRGSFAPIRQALTDLQKPSCDDVGTLEEPALVPR